jgi:hypothetical protein
MRWIKIADRRNQEHGRVRDGSDVVPRENAFLDYHVIDDPEIDLRHRTSGVVEVQIGTVSDHGEERPVETVLGNVDGGCTISAADRRAALGEPLRCVAESHLQKEAAIDRLERDAMVHDREREGAVADGANMGSGRGRAQIFLGTDIALGDG